MKTRRDDELCRYEHPISDEETAHVESVSQLALTGRRDEAKTDIVKILPMDEERFPASLSISIERKTSVTQKRAIAVVRV